MMIEKESKEENAADYIDSLKHYKAAAEQAGMKVKFINVSVDDEFKYNLTLALQEGIIQTKAKY